MSFPSDFGRECRDQSITKYGDVGLKTLRSPDEDQVYPANGWEIGGSIYETIVNGDGGNVGRYWSTSPWFGVLGTGRAN
jgi:hypothetical protein